MGKKKNGLWVALSTHMPMSRLALEGSSDAFKLWALALCVARQEQSSGDVNPRAAGRLAGVGPEAAEELLSLHYWHRSGHDCDRCPQPPEGRVQIHAYLEWQDSPEEIAARTEAGRAAARARWEERGTDSGSHAVGIQNKNKNKNKKTPSLREGVAPEGRREQPKRATPPPKWVRGEEPLPDAIRKFVTQEGLNERWVQEQLVQVLDYALAHGKSYKDWEAMVRRWLRTALQDVGRRRGVPVGQELETELREWERVNPVPVPAELEELEAEDGAEFARRMAPLREEHRARGLAELRRRGMRSVE